jgi:two-component system LytT family response regulator
MKAIIVDDEAKARQNLQNLIEQYTPSVSVVGTASGIKEAVNEINNHTPDIIFLDIEMQGESGFDLFEHFPAPDFHVIFVTAHDEYAIKAFKYSASDYLLKPVDIDELEHAVEMVNQSSDSQKQKDQLQFLLTNFKSVDSNFHKIVLPTLESLQFVEVTSIVRCESNDNYTYVHLDTGKSILVSKNIKHFEELLESQGFFRLHRSHLVNLNCISEYFRGEGGYVSLKDGSSIPVARRKKAAFLERIQVS